MKIIDNFLDYNDFDIIKDRILGNNFPWYFLNFKVFEGDGNCQHMHILYEDNKINSDYFELFKPFLKMLNINSLVKMKLNMTLRDKTLKPYEFHTDVNFDCNTSIFYFNTNNGKTIFDNGKKVKSLENRLVSFPSKLKHTGTSTTDKPYRIVLNINYF